MLTHLDLFSGIGGFALATRWAGFKTLGFMEIDSFCSRVLKKHWPDVENFGDIRSFKFSNWPEKNSQSKPINLITAGFPCQPFSVAGKQKGKQDARHLWPECYRIIKEAKPNWFVGENVPGIVGMELDNILVDLENQGYETTTFVLPACAANAPHRRDRVWIVANRNGERFIDWRNTGERGHIQNNQIRNVAKIQSEGQQLKPFSWSTYTAKDWFDVNTITSRKDDGLPNGVDRIKSLGNAIVPQVAYPILAFIADIEREFK
jgi:DNA (cytosine-5)-methyltransferase 1